MLVAAGRLKQVRACCASVARVGVDGLQIDADAAKMLEVQVGDEIVAVAR
jgi:arginine N-succinyltransferase